MRFPHFIVPGARCLFAFACVSPIKKRKIEVRLIRFVNWAENIKDCELEVLPLEEEDRYIIYFDGKITPRYK